MAFDWKVFAANFLDQAATGVQQNRIDAKEYEDKMEAQVERNKVLRAKRESTARQAAQFGKRARALGADDAMIQMAMSSGVNEIGQFYQKLEQLHQQMGLAPGEKLSRQDIQAAVSMPDLPAVKTDLVDFAMQTYGAKLPEGAVEAPKGETSFLQGLVGAGYKDRIKREMAEDTSYGGMSALELSQLASMEDYNTLLEGAYVTYQDPKIMDAEVALEFNDGLIDEIAKYKSDYEQELTRLRASTMKLLKDKGIEGPEALEQVQDVINAKILKHVEPYIMAHTSMYKDSFFRNTLTKRALVNAFGEEYYQDLMEEYGYGQEELPDGEMPMNTKSNLVSEAEAQKSLDDPDSALAPRIPEDTSMQKPNTVSDMDERDGITPAAPLDDTGKASIEKALSGRLVFSDDEDKYSDRYTREQWKEMSRQQRRELGLPESAVGGLNFYFRDDLDELLEEPRANLEIVKNSNSQTFKVRIKGRGTYTVTREQLDQIPEGYFTGSSPAIIISEYEEGEKPAKKITSNVLKRLR